MIFWTLLAAKIEFGEWLKLLMAAGVFVIYIINYLINETKQNRKRQQQRKPVAATLQRTGEPPRSPAQALPPMRSRSSCAVRRSSGKKEADPKSKRHAPRLRLADHPLPETHDRPPLSKHNGSPNPRHPYGDWLIGRLTPSWKW